MSKERCYTLSDGHGGCVIVRARKRPDAKTRDALIDLFYAARQHLEKRERKGKRK